MDVYPLNPLLHNHPEQIVGEVERLRRELASSAARVVVGYADCGTYGALDRYCIEQGLERLPGLHCYDLYAGVETMRRTFEAQPGTYVLTDFLVRSFERTVVRELGLDRYPELRDDYFGQYTEVVWLAQHRTAELELLADRAAQILQLPLRIIDTGITRLEVALGALVAPAGPA